MTPLLRKAAVPGALILLALVPSIAGGARLVELARGAEITTENARFFAMPLPMVLHVLTVIPFAILGALQFAPSLRRRGSVWHRRAGRVLAPCGLVAALTGLWMAHGYPWPEADGYGLYVLRLVFGTAMAVSIVLALIAVARRDFATHGAWMIRAYAIGMGAGTQVFTQLPWLILVGQLSEVPRTILMGAGWVINVVVAEWVIARSARRRAPRPAPA